MTILQVKNLILNILNCSTSCMNIVNASLIQEKTKELATNMQMKPRLEEPLLTKA